jgi:ferritin
MKAQAQEEIAHAMIFYNYVNEAGGDVVLGAIAKPSAKYKSALDVFEKTLAHEQKVTASINDLMDLAVKEKDYSTQRRLDWFISEQVEEEANGTDMIHKLKLIGDGNGIFMLDQQVGARTFVPPSPLAAAE